MTSSPPPPSTPTSAPPPYSDDIKLPDDKTSFSSPQPRRTFPFLLSLLHQPVLITKLDPDAISVVQSSSNPNVYTITDCLIKAFKFNVVYDARFTPLPDGMLVESDGPFKLAPFKLIWKIVVEETDDPNDEGFGRCRISLRAEAKVVGWLRFFANVSAGRLEKATQKVVQSFLVKVREEAEKEKRGVKVTK